MNKEKIVISIVSHNQANIVQELLSDLEKFNFFDKILITINTKEDIKRLKKFSDLPIDFIINDKVKGFGENHNYAFTNEPSDYFIIINPDVRLYDINFNKLINYFDNSNVQLLSPLAVDKNNISQDNARKFPTILTPFLRKIKFFRKTQYFNSTDYNEVDWVSGMFMIVKSMCFKNIGMFDEKFFMYYEDVDLCKRIKKVNGKVLCINTEKVFHEGQRQSHTNLKHLRIHLKSMIYYHLKYFLK